VKTKALKDFKAETSTVRVIMLSMDKAGAGTNLIEATHIILFGKSQSLCIARKWIWLNHIPKQRGCIGVSDLAIHPSSPTNCCWLTAFVDPPGGSLSEAHAIESQAIGRACRQGQDKSVTVVRFIMSNTIEHERFNELQTLRDAFESDKADAKLRVVEEHDPHQFALGFEPGTHPFMSFFLSQHFAFWAPTMSQILRLSASSGDLLLERVDG
jgi:hypothetical protein